MEHVAYWRGRRWTIRAVKDDDEADIAIGANAMAVIHSNQALILYRASLPIDTAIMAVLHEAAHEMFPEWEREPNETSHSEIGTVERDMKGFLEAFGVDLSPLLPKPEAKRSKSRTS